MDSVFFLFFTTFNNQIIFEYNRQEKCVVVLMFNMLQNNEDKNTRPDPLVNRCIYVSTRNMKKLARKRFYFAPIQGAIVSPIYRTLSYGTVLEASYNYF